MFDTESMIRDAIRQADHEAGFRDLLRKKDPSQEQVAAKFEALRNAVFGGPRFNPVGLDEATQKKFAAVQRKAAEALRQMIEKVRRGQSTGALQMVAMRAIREIKMALAAVEKKPDWVVPYVRGVERTMSALAA